jgi:transcriptional regulator with XRE-family HTH domain
MKLIDYLTARNITATAFAEKVGVPQPTMNRYLNNNRFPKPEMIARIDAATGGKVKFNDWLEQQREHRSANPQRASA